MHIICQWGHSLSCWLLLCGHFSDCFQVQIFRSCFEIIVNREVFSTSVRVLYIVLSHALFSAAPRQMEFLTYRTSYIAVYPNAQCSKTFLPLLWDSFCCFCTFLGIPCTCPKSCLPKYITVLYVLGDPTLLCSCRNTMRFMKFTLFYLELFPEFQTRNL